VDTRPGTRSAAARLNRRQLLSLLPAALAVRAFGQYTGKTLIAHRGASCYSPENTLPAYRLALDQGSDYVEQDLQISKDHVPICLHDETLERTTNVRDVFPNRFREEEESAPGGGRRTVRRWYACDFTVAEIQQLDAGSWFAPEFKGTRVPTFQQAIDLVRGRAGLFPETKSPEFYTRSGFPIERLVLEVLKKNGLERPGADPRTPVIIQSFSAPSLRKMVDELGCKLPKVLLIGQRDRENWLTPETIGAIREFAVGIGPHKSIVRHHPEVVRLARRHGLSVTIYTARSADTDGFASVREEMEFYLRERDVDAIFTDNPDQFPR
jgi:glycerophosphoryl diester phosphodiesterase